MNLEISAFDAPLRGAPVLEMVERKGLGHPDTICDALAENLSLALSRHYLERCGRILHHNVDKGLLVGGTARPAFGGGEVDEPIEIYIAGRATSALGGLAFPVEEIAVEESRRWLRAHLRYLDADRDVRIHSRLRPTSPDLAALFLRERPAGAPLANDSSMGAGYAPLDELERVVLAVERALNSPGSKRAHPEAGEDVKVVGLRNPDGIELTVACAFVGRHVADLADYRAKKARLCELARAAARSITNLPVEVAVNAADGETPDSIYLTVTGLSAEAGDDGQVGRGNRANGLITPYRPMTLEAVAGKNPVTHVGKLYNLAAQRIAQRLVEHLPGVAEAQCYLLSRIGMPIDDPRLMDVRVRLHELGSLDALRPRIEEIARSEVEGIDTIWRELLDQPRLEW